MSPAVGRETTSDYHHLSYQPVGKESNLSQGEGGWGEEEEEEEEGEEEEVGRKRSGVLKGDSSWGEEEEQPDMLSKTLDSIVDHHFQQLDLSLKSLMSKHTQD